HDLREHGCRFFQPLRRLIRFRHERRADKCSQHERSHVKTPFEHSPTAAIGLPTFMAPFLLLPLPGRRTANHSAAARENLHQSAKFCTNVRIKPPSVGRTCWPAGCFSFLTTGISRQSEESGKGILMHWNQLEGNWKRLKGTVKEKWGK